MFTELFQVIEGETNYVQDYGKYSALRDALSHRVLDPDRSAMKWVKHHYPPPYDFVFTPNHEFNYNSDKNSQMLWAEASKLKGIAISYLNTRM
jgi:hypothetical protein